MSDGLPPGWNLSAMFRMGDGTIYKSRPAANRIAARRAWDHFAETGPIKQLRLLDGYWGVLRPDPTDAVEEVEAVHFRRGRKWSDNPTASERRERTKRRLLAEYRKLTAERGDA